MPEPFKWPPDDADVEAIDLEQQIVVPLSAAVLVKHSGIEGPVSEADPVPAFRGLEAFIPEGEQERLARAVLAATIPEGEQEQLPRIVPAVAPPRIAPPRIAPRPIALAEAPKPSARNRG